MTIKFDVKINSNNELIKDIEALINKHKENIENVTTQYSESDTGPLFNVNIQFYPLWVEMKEDNA